MKNATWFFQKVFNNRTLLFLLLFFVLAFIGSLPYRHIHVDEGWFGENAYWLVKDGIVKLESMQGYQNYDEMFLPSHKMFVYFGALVIKMFGFSIYALKLSTLFLYTGVFVILYLFHKRYPQSFTFHHFLITSIIIFINPLLFFLGFTFRPEALLMVLGLLTYIFIINYIKREKIVWVILAGICAGVAFAAHMHSLIYCGAGFFLLLFSKKYKGVLLFTLTVLVFSLLYAIDLWQPGRWQMFLTQLHNFPIHKFSDKIFADNPLGFVLRRLSALLTEHQRYFWGIRVIGVSVLFLLSCLVGFKYLFKNHKELSIYTISVVILLGIFGSHKAEVYLAMNIPFMAMMIACIVVYLFNTKDKPYAKSFFLLALAIQLIFTSIYLIKIYSKNRPYVLYQMEVMSKISNPNAKILVPETYVFDALGKYDIQNYSAHAFYEIDLNRKLTAKEFYQRIYGQGIDYVIADKENLHRFKLWFGNGKVTANPYYKLIYKDDNIIIAEKIKS